MNISEIADLAGVSRATVSRFLNNGYVSAEKQEKIQKVIDETGYIPSAHARVLRTKKTKLVGIIIPKISSETISRIVDGISSTLDNQGYQVILGNSENRAEKEINFLKIFQNNQVDGIILSATILTKEHMSLMKKMKIPIVIVGQEVDQYCCVFHDDFGAAKELTQLLIERSKGTVGYIGVTQKDKAAGYQRRLGYETALAQQGMDLNLDCIKEGSFNMDSGYDNMKAIYESHPEITGVFCSTDTIAVGAVKYLEDVGIKAGEQIAIAGIGDNKMATIISPKLTSAHYYYKTSGIEAASMLLGMMENNLSYIKKLKLGYKIIYRETL